MSILDLKINESWQKIMAEEFNKPYYLALSKFLDDEVKNGEVVLPSAQKLFSAFNMTPFEKVKVIILGQDPYHNIGQAEGLSFSVSAGQKLPPSLKNIFKELKADLEIPMPDSGSLEKWAKQGVLLLNSILSVRAHQPGSHRQKGWELFTDEIIKQLSLRRAGLVFLLWGKYAQDKEKLIDSKKHHILLSAHPSPFSAYKGFLGCKHFSQTNEILNLQNKTPINWDTQENIDNLLVEKSFSHKIDFLEN